jgi:nucleoid DNA-binding protein
MYPNILRKDMEKVVETIIFEMIEALHRDEAVEIRGWGRLKVVTRRARMGRNPRTSQQIPIVAKKAISWKMSKVLFNRLNNNFTKNKISANN